MNYKIIILAAAFLSFLFSCGDEPTNPGADVLQISAYAPTYARVGAVVTLTGNKFGDTVNSSYVSFNNIRATEYTSWSNTQIKVKIPAGAVTGKIYVVVNGKKSNEVSFTVITYEPEHLESLTIGSQVWSKRNLNVDHYCNGDPIPQVQNPAEWAKLTTGAWCYINNQTESGEVYGKLYNQYAVNDPRGLAPEGWHIPSDDEWKELESNLGIDDSELNVEGWRGKYEGGMLKEFGTDHWISPNTGATDVTNFTALPGGMRFENGEFSDEGFEGNWWTSTLKTSSNGISRKLMGKEGGIGRNQLPSRAGMSIRCVKNIEYDSPVISSISPVSSKIGEIVSIYGSGFGQFQGPSYVTVNSINLKKSDYLNWGANQIQFIVPKGAESGKISVTVYNRKSNELSFFIYERGTVTDVDGNTYNTIKIGKKWWMAENLKVTKYKNGNPIFEEKDPDKWTALTKGAMCYYNNDEEKLAVYGRLYNWYAVNDSRGLAPKGWHIPTDDEWKELYDYLGGSDLAGGKLKEKGYAHWLTPNMGATDVIDFKALPGGCRYKEGSYMSITQSGFWWSSTENSLSNVGYFSLRHNYPSINWHGFDREGGCSIRCVKD